MPLKNVVLISAILWRRDWWWEVLWVSVWSWQLVYQWKWQWIQPDGVVAIVKTLTNQMFYLFVPFTISFCISATPTHACTVYIHLSDRITQNSVQIEGKKFLSCSKHCKATVRRQQLVAWLLSRQLPRTYTSCASDRKRVPLPPLLAWAFCVFPLV